MNSEAVMSQHFRDRARIATLGALWLSAPDRAGES